MNRLIAIIAMLAFQVVVSRAATNTYQLVWADDFNIDGRPDSANWTYEKGFVRNNELQWYQSENAFCTNGLLIIEGRKEQKPNPIFQEGSSDWRKSRKNIEYTSACLITRGLHSWKYGRFEIKARIKTENGLWPAIWFLGIEGGWPHNGEIDLMEYYDNSILANACWGKTTRFDAEWDSAKMPMRTFNDPEWDKKYHLWRMDWDETSIRLYLDNRLLNTIEQSKAENKTEQWGPKHPFKQPHYLLLNLALGGNRGGDPSGTTFPSRYEIDYVRIYRKISTPAQP